jgi:hypothetical protein
MDGFLHQASHARLGGRAVAVGEAAHSALAGIEIYLETLAVRGLLFRSQNPYPALWHAFYVALKASLRSDLGRRRKPIAHKDLSRNIARRADH